KKLIESLNEKVDKGYILNKKIFYIKFFDFFGKVPEEDVAREIAKQCNDNVKDQLKRDGMLQQE
ncbi:MAG: hypothetical protein R6U32_01195, partial [Candidatus Woesearchaeota archaeon]